jgi:hypothetical protein
MLLEFPCIMKKSELKSLTELDTDGGININCVTQLDTDYRVKIQTACHTQNRKIKFKN